MSENIDAFKQLLQDCLEAYEMLSTQITVAHLDYELDDEELFQVFFALTDRFRALAPDWPGVLPLETPEVKETTWQRLQRLRGEQTE